MGEDVNPIGGPPDPVQEALRIRDEAEGGIVYEDEGSDPHNRRVAVGIFAGVVLLAIGLTASKRFDFLESTPNQPAKLEESSLLPGLQGPSLLSPPDFLTPTISPGRMENYV